jgi:hypothetical protein
VGEGLAVDGHRTIAKLSVKFQVFEPQELPQVVTPRGALKRLSCRDVAPACARLAPEGLVDLAD